MKKWSMDELDDFCEKVDDSPEGIAKITKELTEAGIECITWEKISPK